MPMRIYIGRGAEAEGEGSLTWLVVRAAYIGLEAKRTGGRGDLKSLRPGQVGETYV